MPLRRLVAQVAIRPSGLVLPLFVKEDIREPQPVSSMPGVVQHTRESLRKAASEAVAAGVGGLILFGVPAAKDARGSAADDPDGIVQVALRDLAAEVGHDTVLMADLCLDEYTDHGHCGLLTPTGEVDNDATLDRYASIAVAQAAAGAHVVAPSGMMDGQVGAIRTALDSAGYPDVAICAYSVKYASAFYGPFREAAECAPQFGDRAAYQQDPAAAKDGLREALLDVEEGADIVMVKPGPGIPGRDQPARRDRTAAGGRLSGQRRVRDGRGSRRERLAGPGPDHHGDADGDLPCRRRHHPHLLGCRGCAQAELVARRLSRRRWQKSSIGSILLPWR